jgi:hypothetical protein
MAGRHEDPGPRGGNAPRLANLGPDLFAELVDARVPPLAIVDLMVGVELSDYTDGVALSYFPSAALSPGCARNRRSRLKSHCRRPAPRAGRGSADRWHRISEPMQPIRLNQSKPPAAAVHTRCALQRCTQGTQEVRG